MIDIILEIVINPQKIIYTVGGATIIAAIIMIIINLVSRSRCRPGTGEIIEFSSLLDLYDDDLNNPDITRKIPALKNVNYRRIKITSKLKSTISNRFIKIKTINSLWVDKYFYIIEYWPKKGDS